MATPACAAPSPPCWALPLLEENPNADSDMALRTERRLLALRHKMESGDHKYNRGRVLPPSPSLGFEDKLPPRMPSSIPFAPLTSEGQRPVKGMQTPRDMLERNIPLKTPPTPGRKRRFLGSAPNSSCPGFLPLGVISQREEEKRLSAFAIPPPQREASSSSNESEYCLNPRYNSPWLAGYAISAPPLASIEIRTEEQAIAVPEKQPEPETGKAKSVVSPDPKRAERDAFLLDKLQAVARMMDSNDAKTLASAAQPSSSPRGIQCRVSPNQHPNEGRTMRHMSMSHGPGSNSRPSSERISRYAVRSLSLNMLQSNLDQPARLAPKESAKSSSFTDGETLSPLTKTLTKSLSLGISDRRTVELYKPFGSGSSTVPIGDLPESQERVFRATTA